MGSERATCPFCNEPLTWTPMSKWGEAGSHRCENDNCDVRPHGCAHDDEETSIAAWVSRTAPQADGGGWADAVKACAKVAETPHEDDDGVDRQIRWQISVAIRNLLSGVGRTPPNPAAEAIASVIEDADDMPHDTPVTVKIGDRVTDFTLTLADLRALAPPINQTTQDGGEA